MTPAILITRPAPFADQFGDRIRREIGFDGEICRSPLLRIEPLDVPDLPADITGLVFTSKNAVRVFARSGQRRDLPCWCVGTATAEAAQALGMTAVAAEGEANSLVQRILADAPQGPLLHLRGEKARGNVAARLTDHGITTGEAVIYRQMPEPLTARAKTLLSRENPVIVPLFSPETARQFACQHNGTARLFLTGISENVMAEVAALRAEKRIAAARIDAEAMLDAVAQLIDAANRIEGGPSSD